MKNDSENSNFGVFDLRSIIYITLFLMGMWGCLSIYNATVFSRQPLFYAGKQFLWLAIGMMVLYLASCVPFSWYKRYLVPLAILSFLALIFVLVFGVRVNGMKGWYSLGPLFIQPSELAKAPYVLFIGWLCCTGIKNKGSFKWMSISLAFAILWIFPIVLQPDYGTVIVYLMGFVVVYWLAGGKIRYMIGLAAVGMLAVAVILQGRGYVLNRIKGFLNPELYSGSYGWHILQFEYTLARGGMWGADWGKAVWANSYLPFSYSDSAFAALTESIGFIGALPVIVGLVVLVIVAYRLAMKVEDELAKNFILAMTALVVMQAFMHISVNLALIPPTGITLPMISYGGSSLVATLLAFGIILSAADNRSDIGEELAKDG